MDGENNGKPYEQMDDLMIWVFPVFLGWHPDVHKISRNIQHIQTQSSSQPHTLLWEPPG